MNRASFIEERNAAWTARVIDLFGDTPPDHATWSNAEDIVAVLSIFMGSGENHTLLPDSGGMDLISVGLASEPGCIAFTAQSKAIYLVRPRRLTFDNFPADPAQSFFILELADLERTRVYEDEDVSEIVRAKRQEEVIELTPGGGYQPRHVWDDDEPLPSTARRVCRFLAGSFMVTNKASHWNDLPATYSGTHDKIGRVKVRELIERMISGPDAV